MSTSDVVLHGTNGKLHYTDTADYVNVSWNYCNHHIHCKVNQKPLAANCLSLDDMQITLLTLYIVVITVFFC